MQSRVWRSEVGRALPPGHGAISLMRSRKRRGGLAILPVLLILATAALVGAATVTPGLGSLLGAG